MVLTGAAAVAAASVPTGLVYARSAMDWYRARERVRRSETGRAVCVYLRPLKASFVVRREGTMACVVYAVPGSAPVSVTDERSPDDKVVAKLRLPRDHSPPNPPDQVASFLRFRSQDDGTVSPDRADCVFVAGVGWFVVVQRHGRVHVGVTRYAGADLIRSMDRDSTGQPLFAAVAEVDHAALLTGEAPPPAE